MKNTPAIGMLVGLILPIVCLGIFLPLVAYGKGYDSVSECIRHFQTFGVLYKIVSLSLMPNAGLFFWWIHKSKLNMARGILSVCMLYGVAIMAIYFW